MVTPLLLVATFLGTPDGGSTETRSHVAGVDRRGDQGMGFSAHAFSSGDFDLPMFIHDRMPPGAETRKRLRTKISYGTEDTPRGARVVIRTGNTEALAAIHEFLRFQIADHRTGDSPEIQR